MSIASDVGHGFRPRRGLRRKLHGSAGLLPGLCHRGYNAAMGLHGFPLKGASLVGCLMLTLAGCSETKSAARDANTDTAPTGAVEAPRDGGGPADATRDTANILATGGSTGAGGVMGTGGSTGTGGGAGTGESDGSAGTSGGPFDGPVSGEASGAGGTAGLDAGLDARLDARIDARLDARIDARIDATSARDAADVLTTDAARDDASDAPSDTNQPNCGTTVMTVSQAPTDVLLLLDRSGSMVASISEDCCCDLACRQASGFSLCSDTSSCTARWPALTSAVLDAMSKSPAIDWGLKLFTSPVGTGSCTVADGVEVAVGPGSAAAVQSQIAQVSPGNSTPTAHAITVATTYLAGVADLNPKAILLATDGEPNCQGGSPDVSDLTGTITAIQAATAAGFEVYVVGIGPYSENLDSFARAGATDHAYSATSAGALESALASISEAVGNCAFAMAEVPPDPAALAVYLDGSLLPEDPSSGWTLGVNDQTIVLNGSACVTAGAASKVQVLFGCPGTSPPPVLP